VRRKYVNNLELERWRLLAAADVLLSIADHAKRDASFAPRSRHQGTRWHVTAGQSEFELLCTGPKFFDTRAGNGGGGALDLVMHLHGLDFKRAVQFLRAKGL
jgi:hypothetical protein